MEEFFVTNAWARVVRYIFILLDVAVFIGLAYSFGRMLEYRPKFSVNPEKRATKQVAEGDSKVRERWRSVIKKMEAGSSDSIRLAIIEADNIVGEVLEKMGLAGEHFAERLGGLRSENLGSFERVWSAHRVRNNLVHTPGYVISTEEARDALAGYESFLREMKTL